MKITIIQSLWRENAGFDLQSDDIGEESIFVHFITPVTIYANGEEVSAAAGACIYWDIHMARHFTSECELIHDWFHADADFARIAREYGLEAGKIYYPASDTEMTEMISDMELELVRGGKLCTELVEASARRICIKLARATEIKDEIHDAAQKSLFRDLRREIHESFAEKWTVGRMAELARMSESRFCTVYRQVFGISPMKDLEHTRIRRAELYLSRGVGSVSEAAEYAGYTNQYHFIRRFKALTGATPGKYKKK